MNPSPPPPASPPPPSPTAPGPDPRASARADSAHWPLVVVAIGPLLLIALGLFFRFARDTARDTVSGLSQNIRALAARAETIAAKFKQGTITTAFVAALPELAGTGIGNLEVAISTATEILRREDSLSLFGDRLPLGTTVSEIRVPVTYRYHVRLSDPWRLEVSNQMCVVHAPRLLASL